MIPNIGPLEIGVILLIALIVFGPKRLPELGRSMGRGLREFRGSVMDRDDDEKPASLETGAVAMPDGEREGAAAEPTARA